MSPSAVDQADRNARNRAWIMALGAIVFLVLAILAAAGPPGDVSATRTIGWAALVLLWLLMLATGGGLMLNRKVRSLMNDEVSVHNRGQAIATGFWTAMIVAVLLYVASLVRPIMLREGLSILTEVAIAAALLRYAWLERA